MLILSFFISLSLPNLRFSADFYDASLYARRVLLFLAGRRAVIFTVVLFNHIDFPAPPLCHSDSNGSSYLIALSAGLIHRDLKMQKSIILNEIFNIEIMNFTMDLERVFEYFFTRKKFRRCSRVRAPTILQSIRAREPYLGGRPYR